MAKKRDLVGEILEKRKLLGRRKDPFSLVQKRCFALFLGFYHLEKLPKKEKELKDELKRYFAVGLVSCLEGYYRLIMKELIDHGPPYRDNAARLEDLKFDVSTIMRMQMQSVSVGEMISHLASLSSIEDINRHMSTLLGTDYFDALKPLGLWRDQTFGSFHPRAWQDLSDVFHDRHIACHELNPRMKWTFRRVTDQWRVVQHLIEANEKLIRNLGIRPEPKKGKETEDGNQETIEAEKA